MLDYIRKHVTEWPEGATEVYLCDDGEIMFEDSDDDFFPEEEFKGVFIPDEGCRHVGRSYTREEWEQTETDLTTLDKPFGELDRATQLKLVEHVLDGGAVEKLLDNGNWCGNENRLLCFVSQRPYRAIKS